MMAETTNSQYLELGKKQAALFDNDNLSYINCLASNPSMRTVMNKVYNAIVGAKKVISIEELTKEQKLELWEGAKEFAAGKLNQQQMIEFTKSLYALNYFCGQ